MPEFTLKKNNDKNNKKASCAEPETREIVHQLIALVVLPEDPGPIPRTHISRLTTLHNPSSDNLTPTSGSLLALLVCGAQTYTELKNHPHKMK